MALEETAAAAGVGEGRHHHPGRHPPLHIPQRLRRRRLGRSRCSCDMPRQPGSHALLCCPSLPDIAASCSLISCPSGPHCRYCTSQQASHASPASTRFRCDCPLLGPDAEDEPRTTCHDAVRGEQAPPWHPRAAAAPQHPASPPRRCHCPPAAPPPPAAAASTPWLQGTGSGTAILPGPHCTGSPRQVES